MKNKVLILAVINLIVFSTITAHTAPESEKTVQIKISDESFSQPGYLSVIVEPVRNNPGKTVVGSCFVMAGAHIFASRTNPDKIDYNDPIINLVAPGLLLAGLNLLYYAFTHSDKKTDNPFMENNE